MWKCHKCGKPVYFAERKQSLGYDWHPECLRCEECGKRLNPGQHAEHKGVPYCHVPCYGALFGPQLFGHGTRVESHKNFGTKGTQRSNNICGGSALPRDHLESKLKVYNQFYDNKSMEIRSREVNNRLILEGALRVCWGVQGVIHLKEDDDQRTLVVRKRNSCRVSRAAEDSGSDKENDVSESFDAPTTTSEPDGLSTDISLSESMTFDSCSLNGFPVSDFPTTPEESSASVTAVEEEVVLNGSVKHYETSDSSCTLCDLEKSSNTTDTLTHCVSSTLPSNLDKLEKMKWDEIDELLQVERRLNGKDKIYETMPSKLPSSSSHSSTDSSPIKTNSTQNLTKSSNIQNSETTTSNDSSSLDSSPISSCTTTSQNSTDNFMTATTSLSSATNEKNTSGIVESTKATSLENNVDVCDVTLKPMDFDEFKRSIHEDIVNCANLFQVPRNGTLKLNQPIDPSRINDSLKLYSETNGMSKSFNCEHALRSINSAFINDNADLKNDLENDRYSNRLYALQKSGSASNSGNRYSEQHKIHSGERSEKSINRSKSGPSCFVYSDSEEDESTLKPQRPSTIKRSEVQQRYIKIQMDCYPKESTSSECDSSRTSVNTASFTHSGAVGGDELTQTDDLLITTGENPYNPSIAFNDAAHHVTEDGVVLRRPPRTGATAIKRRSGNRRSRTKLKRRCSINGHFYNRETSFFTPPYGSQMSVWVTSLVTAHEVINLLLEKYKVDSPSANFSLFVMRDNGEQKRLKENDYPLIVRVMLGPHEDVARLFLVDAKKTDEISNEVAQFINLSLPECRAILERYDQEYEREVMKIKERYAELRRRITSRMESLKVHL